MKIKHLFSSEEAVAGKQLVILLKMGAGLFSDGLQNYVRTHGNEGIVILLFGKVRSVFYKVIIIFLDLSRKADGASFEC